MSDFYSLTPDQQAEKFSILAREAVRFWNLSDPVEIELIKHRENAVFSVKEVSSAKKYVLRIHRANYHTDAALISELTWMKALADSGISTPPVIPTAENKLIQIVSCDDLPIPHQCDLFGWVDGKPLGDIEGERVAEKEIMIRDYKLLGQQMAKLHAFSSSWKQPDGFERHAWDIDGLAGDNPVWGRFWELEPLTDSQKELISKAQAKLKTQLESFGKNSDRYGLIHADFLPENLLVSDDGMRLIDFDDSGFGWYLFDLATTLFFHLGEDYFDDLFGALLEGYRTVRDLSDEELEYLPAFFLARGFPYRGWAHTRKETEAAIALTGEVIEGVCAIAEDYLSG
ncbi:MAG: phosphotransferase [Deltaproteobacteria bacterium]|nr:phosphotransferase [Deltaproteobacteria bacterium]